MDQYICNALEYLYNKDYIYSIFLVLDIDLFNAFKFYPLSCHYQNIQETLLYITIVSVTYHLFECSKYGDQFNENYDFTV